MAAASMGEVSASIVAGPPATLVNVSAGGALLEVASRIPLRGSVRLRLTMPTGERIQVEGSLAWARVAKIAGGQVTYRIAVEFTRPIAALATSEVDASEVEAEVIDAQETGAEEQAPRTEALERELAATSADLACQTALIETLAARLEAAIRMRKTASAEWKRERERWEDERARLIQQLAAATARADALQARVDAREREHGEAEHMRDDDEPT
jgi:hypothetical protein